jgi:hypothetical protein
MQGQMEANSEKGFKKLKPEERGLLLDFTVSVSLGMSHRDVALLIAIIIGGPQILYFFLKGGIL